MWIWNKLWLNTAFEDKSSSLSWNLWYSPKESKCACVQVCEHVYPFWDTHAHICALHHLPSADVTTLFFPLSLQNSQVSVFAWSVMAFFRGWSTESRNKWDLAVLSTVTKTVDEPTQPQHISRGFQGWCKIARGAFQRAKMIQRIEMNEWKWCLTKYGLLRVFYSVTISIN